MTFSLVLLRRSWSSGQRLALPLISVPPAAAGRRRNRLLCNENHRAVMPPPGLAPGGASQRGVQPARVAPATSSAADGQAHRPGGALDDLLGGLDRGRV